MRTATAEVMVRQNEICPHQSILTSRGDALPEKVEYSPLEVGEDATLIRSGSRRPWTLNVTNANT